MVAESVLKAQELLAAALEKGPLYGQVNLHCEFREGRMVRVEVTQSESILIAEQRQPVGGR